MASSVSSSSVRNMALCSILVLLSFLGHLHVADAQASVPIVEGLSMTFYNLTCPNLETIVRDRLREVFAEDIGQAAGLLRLHFHDCFVQGCDGSVLLDGPNGEVSEKQALPNLTLRPKAYEIVEDLRQRLQQQCGQVVSCADITALAARDAVFLSGGPAYDIPLGRRDSLNFSSNQSTIDNLVAPFVNTTTVLDKLARKNLDATDAVALSGAHTIGISHCTSFTDRLYPNKSSTMEEAFFNNLTRTCPAPDSTNTTFQDIRSPNLFDNKYYVNLVNGQSLFTSDQDLHEDNRTRGIVESFAANETLFFEKFVVGMLKMGQLNVLTGAEGEIRGNCSARNPVNSFLASVVVEEEGNNKSFGF